ncbi:hypothetical protein HRM2_35560 [Desulforapulum autotrophicum HRM2]|uniref:Uncharacterized protein n=1 Tax=Desulforapulum autotrophicum (strain ATCC 43914 / DSM 3382 / VKM B-1955 / HRM2) TaxID=177437 RepID=C0Q9B6_DESAH|nr:hypothetical protein [Desulforapulum autotrophicum]ACN16621.1 hypothetical protein HRM2_35560 [Desulforapulum autotrophicum HRM2]
MIFFCEDCGEKNDLDEPLFFDGKVVFECRACGYGNAYAFGLPREEGCTAGDLILNKICSFPDVIGLFLYHKTNGVVDNRMPVMLTRADVETLGRAFIRTYAGGQSLYSDIQGLCVVMAGKHFTIHPVQAGLLIVIVARTPCLPHEVRKLVIDLGKKSR